jgi:hypothetical protein
MRALMFREPQGAVQTPVVHNSSYIFQFQRGRLGKKNADPRIRISPDQGHLDINSENDFQPIDKSHESAIFPLLCRA